MPYKSQISPKDIQNWLTANNQLFEVNPTSEFIQEMMETCVCLTNLLIKANKRINVIALYLAWRGVVKPDPLFSEQQDLSSFDFDQYVRGLLEEQHSRHDIILFIYSCSYLNLQIRAQGKIITVISENDKHGNLKIINLNSVEWSAEMQMKLSGSVDIKPTEFNSVVTTYRHLVLKAQLVLKLPHLDKLFKERTFNLTTICKLLDIQSYQLTKLIDIAIQMGFYTESQIQDFLLPGNPSRSDVEDDENSDKERAHRYQLSAKNERFIQLIADEHYRGNSFQALNKLISTVQVLIERGLIENQPADGQLSEHSWVKSNNSSLASHEQNEEED